MLGVVNVYTGLQSYHRKTSKSVRVWTIVFTAQISLIIFFYLLQEKWHYIKKQGVSLCNEDVQPTDQETSPRFNLKETSPQPCWEFRCRWLLHISTLISAFTPKCLKIVYFFLVQLRVFLFLFFIFFFFLLGSIITLNSSKEIKISA